MSVTVKYKGNEILSLNTDSTRTLTTSGEYCEDDITIVNTQDGGITPSGNISITTTQQTDVTNYATAQVVDADLVAANIKKDVNILGVVGSYEGTSGGDFNPLLYVRTGGELFYGATNLPRKTHFVFGPSVKDLNQVCRATQFETGDGDAEIKITKVAGGNAVTLLNFAFYETEANKIIIDFDTSHVTNWSNAFRRAYPYGLREIVGTLDFSSATRIDDMFFASSSGTLTEVRFAPNTLKLDFTGNNLISTAWSHDSAISIANGLNEATSGKSIRVARSFIDSMIGTSALDPSGTCHIFTEGENGTMTLSEFITNVKGWTLV